MKKTVIFAVAFLVITLVTAKTNSSLAKDEYRLTSKRIKTVELLVTAYYKPLPKQKKYATGSYKGDLRLNGTGRTFSEKEASRGDASADHAVLPMGTIINIPGHGMVKIEDKGKDIKGKRLDIFMGIGEEGLVQALEWGKKVIKAEVIKWGGQ